MSDVFIELYLDEDVDVLVADLIRARGFNVTTTQEAGRKGADDEPQLAFAASQQWTLMTHNRVDFERLAQDYFAAGRTHSGIIIAARRDAQKIARRLLAILNQTTADEMTNQLRYI